MIEKYRLVRLYKDAFGREYFGVQWTEHVRHDIGELLDVRKDVAYIKDERYEIGDWVVKRASDGSVSWHTRDTMSILFMEVIR